MWERAGYCASWSVYVTTKSKKVGLGTENLFSMTDNQNRSTENHFWSTGNLFKLIGRRETISG